MAEIFSNDGFVSSNLKPVEETFDPLSASPVNQNKKVVNKDLSFDASLIDAEFDKLASRDDNEPENNKQTTPQHKIKSRLSRLKLEADPSRKEMLTPASKSRFYYKQWSVDEKRDSKNKVFKSVYRFYHENTPHVLEVMSNPTPKSVIILNGFTIFDSSKRVIAKKQIIEFHVTKNLYLGVVLDRDDMDFVDHEIRINGLDWSDARRDWVQKKLVFENSDYEIKNKKGVPKVIADSEYIRDHWNKTEFTKHKKKIVTWQFTIAGSKKVISLEHSKNSKTVFLNNRKILEKKIGLFDSDFDDNIPFSIDNIKCQIIIKFDSFESVYSYDLSIDNVLFSESILLSGTQYGDLNAFSVAPEEKDSSFIDDTNAILQ